MRFSALLGAGALGFGVRAGVNCFLLLFRIYRAPRFRDIHVNFACYPYDSVFRKFQLAWIRHAVLGQDSFRFAALLGSFTALYKLILNALPILFPPAILTKPTEVRGLVTEAPTPMYEVEAGHPHQVFAKRSSQLSVRAQYQIKQTKRWHAAVAGFISGGIAVSFEAKGRRLAIAQQIFVRYSRSEPFASGKI
jgi:hypothetical protein